MAKIIKKHLTLFKNITFLLRCDPCNDAISRNVALLVEFGTISNRSSRHLLLTLRTVLTRLFIVFQSNSKVKLLVRSHAMRESTSPPREPHNGSSPNSLSPNSNSNPNSKQLNNNEPMLNSNLCPTQNPKQMRNSATSPTCRTPSRNGNYIYH